MKFLRYESNGAVKPGLKDQDTIYDLSEIITDISSDNIGALITSQIDVASLPKVQSYNKLCEPIAGVGKVICVGLNYADHAKESGLPLPKEPIIFMKATSSITGPDDDVQIPRKSVKTDWEVELGVVIGKKCKYVEEKDAFDYIAGYTIVNDVSEREFQIEREGQWTKGKSHDTFSPIGPYLVTKDEIKDVQNLAMKLSVDGKVYQDGNTNTMHFQVAFLVSYLSQFMTLMPGDIISTGTPPGVGLGQTPPVYLKPGQVMKVSIEGLGEQEQKTVQA